MTVKTGLVRGSHIILIGEILMSKENENVITKNELEKLIASAIRSSVQSQQSPRIQALKETSILHYLNFADKSKALLRATADLGLAVIDAGVAIPASLIKSEIIIPSLNCDSLTKWLWEEEQKEETVLVIEQP